MQYSQENTWLTSHLNKVEGHEACNLLKGDPSTDFFLRILGTFKNNYFEEHLHTAASEVTLGSDGLGLSSGESLSKPS